ncbi:dinitrogenase iron-molybdenum cofactor biosynthesis protein [Methanoplanus sp. FWC-SCC4]|uniref:Dinitrogenase iron-molybdenum cofactor biosynthesis protein n=1 Tax=Methanochimaera problematica TaxID=2609417 RepID=A0AA97FBL7_9EURY|nr:NifB/NifX family molybdenum-iron cluster-binding protein [Methanoplanus sp. FWC-SCC4]WOF15954.1 dinitrogenase iron-molybdenum cofactor biosynthesis protein [Methanoplanus sp. FWC-SCC4]
MKIAVAKDGDIVAEHFGHCSHYAVYNIEDGKVISKTDIESPGHAPGVIPRFLNENGANIVLAGGMGQGAINLFNEMDIDVYLGVSGSIENAVQKYLAGELISGNNTCDH